VKASDDAAGLAIGTKLKGDVTVLTQAGINAAQGASMLQVADGGLARISDVLQRMKALAAQSLSGVPTDTERGFIDAEYQELILEIDGIAETTRFNGESLLDGTDGRDPRLFVGTDVADVIGSTSLGLYYDDPDGRRRRCE
jgi:flagellin